MFIAGLAAIAALAETAGAQTLAYISPPEAPAQQQPPVEDRDRAVTCLSAAIAYEAAFEPVEGQQAVAEVILNRVRDPAFPKSVCGVVFAGSERRTGCQFSFTCDGSLRRRLSASVMAVTRQIAVAALDGANPQRVAGATHYHANYVSPYWAPSLIRIGRIGAHIFYRVPGAKDQGDVSLRYAARDEPSIAALGFLGGGGRQPAATSTQVSAPSGPPAPFAPWGLGGR